MIRPSLYTNGPTEEITVGSRGWLVRSPTFLLLVHAAISCQQCSSISISFRHLWFMQYKAVVETEFKMSGFLGGPVSERCRACYVAWRVRV